MVNIDHMEETVGSSQEEAAETSGLRQQANEFYQWMEES